MSWLTVGVLACIVYNCADICIVSHPLESLLTLPQAAADTGLAATRTVLTLSQVLFALETFFLTIKRLGSD